MKRVQLDRLKIAAQPPHQRIRLLKNTPGGDKADVAFTNVRVDDLEAAISLIEDMGAKALKEAT
jgi:hypothetical protein